MMSFLSAIPESSQCCCNTICWNSCSPNAGAISPPSGNSLNKVVTTHRATPAGAGNEVACDVRSVCALSSPAAMWTNEGWSCLDQNSFILVGLEVRLLLHCCENGSESDIASSWVNKESNLMFTLTGYKDQRK